jgi:glutaredoxin
MFKKLFFICLLAFSLIPFAGQAKETATFYYGYSCPHCKNVETFIKDNNVESRLDVKIEKKEIYLNRGNASAFQTICANFNIPTNQRGVPFFVWGDQHFMGDAPIISFLENKLKETDGLQNSNVNSGQEKVYNLPLIGKVDLMKYSLPVLTLVIGAIDGFNPCAMWVLVFLIGALLGLENRKNMWLIGLTFIGASAAIYYLFLAAWLNLFIFIGYIRIVQIIIGGLALFVGAYYLREYWLKKGKTEAECKVVKGDKKKKIIERINQIVESKKIFYALVGIVALAFVVNLIELACSIGLPAIYTQILALSDLPKWQYYLYLLFYIIIFMLDDMIIFTAAMLAAKATGLSGKYTKFSELVGGLIIFLIGVLLILRPEWLMFG